MTHILKIIADDEASTEIISIHLPDGEALDPLRVVPAILGALEMLKPKRKPRSDKGQRKGATA